MHRAGSTAGFVLTGGQSRRMGTDKALLPYGGSLLVDHVAAQVAAAAGSVCLVGQPERYVHLTYPAIPDVLDGIGPLGGILTVLNTGKAEWSLIVACDMAAVQDDVLRRILTAAASSTADAVIPVFESHPQPVCAAYRQSALPALRRAMEAGVRAVHEAVSYIQVQQIVFEGQDWFQNLNTPEEWSEFRENHARR